MVQEPYFKNNEINPKNGFTWTWACESPDMPPTDLLFVEEPCLSSPGLSVTWKRLSMYWNIWLKRNQGHLSLELVLTPLQVPLTPLCCLLHLSNLNICYRKMCSNFRISCQHNYTLCHFHELLSDENFIQILNIFEILPPCLGWQVPSSA